MKSQRNDAQETTSRAFWLVATRLTRNADKVIATNLYAVSGSAKGRITQMRVGDIAFLYLAGHAQRASGKILAAFQVASEMFEQHTTVWAGGQLFPFRIRLNPIVVLTPDRALNLPEILPRLEGGDNPQKWAIRLRGSIARLPEADGKLLLRLLRGRVSMARV